METKEIEFQKSCERLVQNEVLCCISGLAEECFKKEVFNFDDWQNLYQDTCPECGSDDLAIDEETDTFECGCCEKFLPCAEIENKAQEIYEYWIVTEWLYKHLLKRGEPVYSYDDFNFIWGRTTTGQSISMDYVIEEIRKELDKS